MNIHGKNKRGIVTFAMLLITAIILIPSCFDDNFSEALDAENNRPARTNRILKPGNSGSVQLKNNSDGTITLEWDEVMDQNGDITYAVYMSESDNITTVEEIQKNGTAVTDWIEYNGDIKIDTDLIEGKTYYFNILVSDGKNFAAYSPIKITSSDETPPVPGGGGIIVQSWDDEKLVLNWTPASDAVTEDDDLVYQVYMSEQDSIHTPEDITENGTILTGWLKDNEVELALSLDDGSEYYVNILVKDESENAAAYTSLSFIYSGSSPVVDETPPVPGGGGILTVSNNDDDKLVFDWVDASDNKTAAENLRYMIFMSEADNINTVADMEVNGTMLTGWVDHDGSIELELALAEGTTYYFNVTVKDQSDNYGAYDAISVDSMDVTDPVPGSAGRILISNIDESSLTLEWDRAKDNITEREDLMYAIVKSSYNNISTVDDALSNGTSVLDWTADITTVDVISGITPGNTYYFTVIVSDAAGNMSVYTPVFFFRYDDSLYLFATGTIDGNLGGREGADSLCSNTMMNNYPFVSFSNVHALISINNSDQIIDMPSNYGLPEGLYMRSITGHLLAYDWYQLFSSGINMSLKDSGVIFSFDPFSESGDEPTDWWSGSNDDGTINTEEINCNGFTGTSGKATTGSTVMTDGRWLEFNSPNCSAKRHVLCVAWD